MGAYGIGTNSLKCHFRKWELSSKIHVRVISGILCYKERSGVNCYIPAFLKISLTSVVVTALRRRDELQGVFWVQRRRHSFACAKTWICAVFFCYWESRLLSLQCCTFVRIRDPKPESECWHRTFHTCYRNVCTFSAGLSLFQCCFEGWST